MRIQRFGMRKLKSYEGLLKLLWCDEPDIDYGRDRPRDSLIAELRKTRALGGLVRNYD